MMKQVITLTHISCGIYLNYLAEQFVSPIGMTSDYATLCPQCFLKSIATFSSLDVLPLTRTICSNVPFPTFNPRRNLFSLLCHPPSRKEAHVHLSRFCTLHFASREYPSARSPWDNGLSSVRGARGAQCRRCASAHGCSKHCITKSSYGQLEPCVKASWRSGKNITYVSATWRRIY